MTMSTANWEHLCSEMAVLKLRLLRELRRLAEHTGRDRLDHLQGLVVSEQEILSILAGKPGSGSEDSDLQIEKQIDELDKGCTADAESADGSLALQRLSALFGLER